jgi:ectoine hydroxylase-related dioxygenase (phytanoyl-CoA dioxygenase family)
MSDVTVTQSMIDEFERDGVICVRGLIDMPLVERLRLAVDDILEDPSAMAVDSPDTGPANGIARKAARFRQAMNGWMRSDAYHDLVFNSPVPRVASELMKSKAVRILYDQTLVKEPKSNVPVEWHHDLPFWPVSGDQICSTWIALDEVTKDNGPVFYVRGSHKWSQRYRPTVPDTPEFRALGLLNLDLPAAPNYFEEPSADLITWDMQPGDALVFTARTLHGSGANTHSDRARRAIAPRFVGDDGRYVAGMHVLNLSFPTQPALHTGDELNDPLFPVAWEAG